MIDGNVFIFSVICRRLCEGNGRVSVSSAGKMAISDRNLFADHWFSPWQEQTEQTLCDHTMREDTKMVETLFLEKFVAGSVCGGLFSGAVWAHGSDCIADVYRRPKRNDGDFCFMDGSCNGVIGIISFSGNPEDQKTDTGSHFVIGGPDFSERFPF